MHVSSCTVTPRRRVIQIVSVLVLITVGSVKVSFAAPDSDPKPAQFDRRPKLERADRTANCPVFGSAKTGFWNRTTLIFDIDIPADKVSWTERVRNRNYFHDPEQLCATKTSTYAFELTLTGTVTENGEYNSNVDLNYDDYPDFVDLPLVTDQETAIRIEEEASGVAYNNIEYDANCTHELKNEYLIDYIPLAHGTNLYALSFISSSTMQISTCRCVCSQ